MPRVSSSHFNLFSKQIPLNRILLWRVEKALVKPLMKKVGLELVFPSSRPVSNLPFVSKLTEKASIDQLSDHMNQVWSPPPDQANQLINHSTTLKQHFWRCQKVTRRDLSAAFDTVDHSILLETVDFGFGVGGIALKWITSFLSQWTVNSARTNSFRKETPGQWSTKGILPWSCDVHHLCWWPVPDHRKDPPPPPISPGLCRWPSFRPIRFNLPQSLPWTIVWQNWGVG